MASSSEAEHEEQNNLDYGCGSMLLTAIIMIGLITFNSFIVNNLVEQLVLSYAGFTELPRLQRALQIVAPVMILVFQYWIYDFFRDRLWSHANHELSGKS